MLPDLIAMEEMKGQPVSEKYLQGGGKGTAPIFAAFRSAAPDTAGC